MAGPRVHQAEKRQAPLNKEELRERKRFQNPDFDLVQEVLQRWEIFANKKIAQENRDTARASVVRDIKGKVVKFARRRDTSRVMQSLLKCGTKAERQAIADEIIPHIHEVSQMQYGYHVLIKLCDLLGTPFVKTCAQSLTATVHKDYTHGHASAFVDYVFAASTARNKAALLVSLLGPEVLSLPDVRRSTAEEDRLSGYLPPKNVPYVFDEVQLVADVIAMLPLRRKPMLQRLERNVLNAANRGVLAMRLPSAAAVAFLCHSDEPSKVLDLIRMALQGVGQAVKDGETEEGADGPAPVQAGEELMG
ncbi:hypothetical protein KIPB_005623, partial [Kipferlia bialata]|eukprot:g5623.t1